MYQVPQKYEAVSVGDAIQYMVHPPCQMRLEFMPPA